MLLRIVLLLMSTILMGCQPSTAPATNTPKGTTPTVSPSSPAETATPEARWKVGIQNWESGQATEEVMLQGSTVSLPSGRNYHLSTPAWSAPSAEDWSSVKPSQGRYIVFLDDNGKDWYLPLDEDPKLAEDLQALIPRPFAHGAGYAWISGRLEYDDLEGGTWTLVYDEKPEDDPHGGKVVLAEGPPEGLKAGDIVVAFGSIAEQQMGIHMAGTYYEVSEISKLQE